MPLAADKNLFLNMESPRDRVVIGDKKRIVQIGHNLLSNAIKFTERGRSHYACGLITEPCSSPSRIPVRG